MKRRRRPARLAWIATPLVALLVGCDSGGPAESVPRLHDAAAARQPASRAESLRRASETGAYRVEIRPEASSSARAPLHAWLVRVESREGEPVQPARLAFSGGMPQHGHGFQTAPHVTDALPDGWFRVSGIRFHMAGEWTLRVEFVGPSGPDVAIFQVDVPH